MLNFRKNYDTKDHSKIMWPLATTNLTIGPKLDLVLKVFWFQQNGVTFVLDSKILGRLLKDVRGLHGYTISTIAFCCWSQLKCFRSFSSLFFVNFSGSLGTYGNIDMEFQTFGIHNHINFRQKINMSKGNYYTYYK